MEQWFLVGRGRRSNSRDLLSSEWHRWHFGNFRRAALLGPRTVSGYNLPCSLLIRWRERKGRRGLLSPNLEVMLGFYPSLTSIVRSTAKHGEGVARHWSDKRSRRVKEKIEGAETAYGKAIADIPSLRDKLATAEQTASDKANELQELRETWDSAIADLPPDIKALLEKPKHRGPLAVVAKRKGTETLAKWLTDKLANGPKDKGEPHGSLQERRERRAYPVQGLHRNRGNQVDRR